jgi:23S rRNA pseudouridine1911/1915/1917 synthase
VVPAAGSLLEALRALVPSASNRTLRRMIEQGRVRVNSRTVSVGRAPVEAGDVIEVGARMRPAADLQGIEIAFEDDDLVVVNKPSGLLSVATEHETERTAYACLRAHVRRQSPGVKLHIVHRLDKFASGLLVFAKSERIRERLRALFRSHEIERRYWAIVEGRVEAPTGTIRSRLAEDRSRRMHSTGEGGLGKLAVTHFRVLRRWPNLTALEVTLETGRKNQIRAHLSELGHPIAGDRAYRSTTDPLGRLALHAFLLGFTHPSTGGRLLCRTPPPPEFRRYL